MATQKEEPAELELPPELALPDPFVEKAQEYAGWVEKNGRLLLAAAGGVLVLSLVGIVVNNQMKRSASESTAALTTAMKDYRAAIESVETATTSEATIKAAQKALPVLSALQNDHKGSGAAAIARLYEADLLRRAGHFAEAENVYKEYAAQAKPDDALLFLALEGAGYAAEEQGAQDRALSYFQRLSALATPFYRDHGFYHVGRLNEAKGNKAAAIEAYKQIADNYPKSKLREKVDQRLAALK